jgi:hypothetical protein
MAEEATKLIVHAIPYTELEYGGKKSTFEETYSVISEKFIELILNLQADDKRRFNWSDAAFLERWWNDCINDEDRKIRQQFKSLVQKGQI